MSCFGCHLANGKEDVHAVFEDEYVCCILDHSPYNEGHVLILPKRHLQYFDEMDDNTANSVFKAAKILSKVTKELFNPDGITVCQNGVVFDDLTHFHMHVVPRYKGQNFSYFYLEDEEVFIEEKSILEEVKRKFIQKIKVLD